MIRIALTLALLASPAAAADNNPFSGATSIRVSMVREAAPAKRQPIGGHGKRPVKAKSPRPW